MNFIALAAAPDVIFRVINFEVLHKPCYFLFCSRNMVRFMNHSPDAKDRNEEATGSSPHGNDDDEEVKEMRAVLMVSGTRKRGRTRTGGRRMVNGSL
jgi:hypothetical protein